MKKKTTKKLVLAKETVRDLEKAELRNVAGGYSQSDGVRFCEWQPDQAPSAPC